MALFWTPSGVYWIRAPVTSPTVICFPLGDQDTEWCDSQLKEDAMVTERVLLDI